MKFCNCNIFSRKKKYEDMSTNKMADKTVTSCATMLIEMFRKRRSRNTMPTKFCTCLCHDKPNKNKSILEMNDNKFFNCKCNHECIENKNRKKRLKQKKNKKKIVKFEIEHTGSMNSLASPFRTIRPGEACSCMQAASLCKLLTEKSCTASCRSPIHSIGCPYYQRSRTPTYTFDVSPEPKRSLTNGFNFTTQLEQNRVGETNSERPKSFYEWAINLNDVELGELESVSQWGKIHRGRWHGDVMVYTRSQMSSQELEDFQNEVSMLGLIRHENVVLFMGACTDPPNLAVITSVRKGHTLYTHLHLRQSSFHFSSKLSIAKQVAQGMGYLHAKGITLGKLCSRNVFLESKVKIGIADYALATTPVVKQDYCCIPKGQLTYLAPELVKSLRKQGIFMTCTNRATQKCDVYAYGTILYELFLGRFPFEGLPSECIIWRVSQGHSQNLDDKEFPVIFKNLVQSCWNKDPVKRPEFQDVLANMRKMNIPRSLQKKLSLSDSGAINKDQQFGRFISQVNGSPLIRWKKT